jgi:adenylate cyclase
VERTYLARLGTRAERVGVLETIENPLTVVAVVAIWTWGAAINSVLIAAVFFWFDEPFPGVLAVGLILLYALGWFWFAGTGKVRVVFGVLAGVSLVVVATSQVSIGGYAYSGAYFFWSVGISVVFILLLPRNVAIGADIAIAAAAIVFAFLEQTLQSAREAPDPTLASFFFAYTLVAIVLLLAPVIWLLVDRLSFERERAESLLLNVLPAAVAAELKETGSTTPRRYEGVSVLYADIVGFTPQSAGMDPEELIASLNEVFSAFDALARRHGAERIRTIGDNYMVAAGVPAPRDDHAEVLAALGLEMLDYAAASPWSFRIGIDSGPAVAGVIGTEKFQYDIYGDAVTIASRMESHGEAGRIQITEATNRLVEGTFATTRRGPIEVKGKGTLTTYWLDAVRQPAS